ncbi:DUF1559 domain-containing protein [Stieleria sp. JC731]|uniref:DUF1559 domain-containing protein n=1 Tax=Pirellulaceae TaxID=2691357 RepID=UPI001E3E34F3|nr:DUF1559 domain-containing protein [Stieleria sp. JC731]MCC9601490.1 DUF1559 domain-containing protein [Stieleria sp. JC731]
MKLKRQIAGACLGLVFAVLSVGMSPAAAQEKLSPSYIPQDAIAAAFAFPAETLTDKSMEMMPVEVAQAFLLTEVGIDPFKVRSVKIVSGMPSPAGPVAGAVIEFTESFSLDQLVPKIRERFEESTLDGKQILESMGRGPTIQIFQPDSTTVLVGVGGYLSNMLNASASGSSGQLAALTGRMSKRPGVLIATVFGQIRNMVTPMLKQQQGNLPPQLHGLTDLFEQCDALLVNVNPNVMQTKMQITLIGKDESSAQTVGKTLNDSIDFARQMIVAQMASSMQGNDPVEQATVKYFIRISELLGNRFRPVVNGKLVQISDDGGFFSVGVAIGLLLPAVQAARTAARTMSSSNNLKHIGLAMHNYHSAYNTLPINAITDDAGKPLLSWRVAILPFIEEQELYSRFHLDEPWDSDHNKQLIYEMPKVYEHPNLTLAVGETIYQVPFGEGLIMEKDKPRRFRDVIDGLSNTIMAYESAETSAIEWTNPNDPVINMADPLAMMGDSPPGSFQVLMGDGAVNRIVRNVDLDLFRSLLTFAGGERINGF